MGQKPTVIDKRTRPRPLYYVYDLGHTTLEKVSETVEVLENVSKIYKKRVHMEVKLRGGTFNNEAHFGAAIVKELTKAGIDIDVATVSSHFSSGQVYEKQEGYIEFHPGSKVPIRTMVYKVGVHCHRHRTNGYNINEPYGQESFYFLCTVTNLDVILK